MKRPSLVPVFLTAALALIATPVLAAGTTPPATSTSAAPTTSSTASPAPAKPAKGPARQSLDRYLKAIKADPATVQAADDAFQALVASGKVTSTQIKSVVAALVQQKAPEAVVVKVLQDADRLLATKVPLGQLVRQARQVMKQDKTLSATDALAKAEQKITEAREKKAATQSQKTGAASQPAPAGQGPSQTPAQPQTPSQAGKGKK